MVGARSADVRREQGRTRRRRRIDRHGPPSSEEAPAAANLRAEQFVDNRFVEELDRAGFFQGLYP